MRKPYILLVDDDKEILKVYKKILELNGFDVITSDGYDGAISVIENNHVSVLITDIIMPKMNGIQLLDKTKEIKSEIEVIMLTAEGSISGAVEAVKKGAFSYLVKPVEIEELIGDVKKAEQLYSVRMENDNLKQQLWEVTPKISLLGRSSTINELREKARLVGGTDSAVLITGESGTGKEVLAKLIHLNSKRSNEPFICVNCAAFNENLIESELFGSEKGAFTGSDKLRKGRFEMADGGTIFFDEIGELSHNMQVKLLRVLQEKTYERVGGNKTLTSNFRLITATNRDLKKEVAANNFREDLYYRINIIPIEMPPLRERKEDIPVLCQAFLEEFSHAMSKKVEPLDKEIIEKMMSYSWPGNVRELRNIIERLTVLSVCNKIKINDLPEEIKGIGEILSNSSGLKEITKEFEREHIVKMLEKNNWNVTKAAEEMSIARKNLYKKLKDYNIKRD